VPHFHNVNVSIYPVYAISIKEKLMWANALKNRQNFNYMMNSITTKNKTSIVDEIDILFKRLKRSGIHDREIVANMVKSIINQLKLAFDELPNESKQMVNQKIVDLHYILDKDIRYLFQLTEKTRPAEIKRAVQNVKFFLNSNLIVVREIFDN
jgi:hypothetical protein